LNAARKWAKIAADEWPADSCRSMDLCNLS
jgi:hypothetical protein